LGGAAVIASEARQSIARAAWIASSQALLAMTKRVNLM